MICDIIFFTYILCTKHSVRFAKNMRNIIKYILEVYPLSYFSAISKCSPEATNTIASRHIKKRKAITDI